MKCIRDAIWDEDEMMTERASKIAITILLLSNVGLVVMAAIILLGERAK